MCFGLDRIRSSVVEQAAKKNLEIPADVNRDLAALFS